MITKLRAAFTRAKINHPRKLTFGTPHTAAACLIPLDGGITLAGTSLVHGLWGGIALMNGEGFFGWPGAKDDLKNRKLFTTITHLDKKYAANGAQKEAYDKLETGIRAIKNKFRSAHDNRERKKLNKKAQLLADKQQWIIDGLQEDTGIRPEVKEENPIEFKIERGRNPKRRKPAGN